MIQSEIQRGWGGGGWGGGGRSGKRELWVLVEQEREHTRTTDKVKYSVNNGKG